MVGSDRLGRLHGGRPRPLVGVAVAILAVAVATAAIYPLKQIAPFVSLSVVYLPAVLLVSAYWGLALGLATSLLSALAFNFFHLPPVGQLTVSDSRNWVALAAFTTVAVVVSTMAELARSRAVEAERRRREADLAAALAEELLAGSGTATALGTAARRVAEALDLRSAAIELGVADGDERRRALSLRDANDRQIATLLVPRGLPGETAERLRTQVVPALETLIAIALRRDALQAEAVETAALRRSDDVKTALLRAVSHDLRTPLTAIVAAGHALGTASLTPEERSELSAAVVEEGARLAALVDKLLDLSKLQGGGAEPRSDWVSLEDVVLGARDGLQGERPEVRIAIDPDLPTVRAERHSWSGRSPTCWRTRGGTRTACPCQSPLVGPAPASSCASSTRAPGSDRPSASGSSSRSTAVPKRAGSLGPGPASGWRSRRGSSRPTAARSRSSRCPARAPASSSRCRSSTSHPPIARAPTGTPCSWPRRSRAVPDRPRVLVCDDEPQILRALRVILRDAGFEAVPASSADEALDLAAVQRLDAGIIDLVLPDGDGVELCSRLREWSEMPLIVLSAVGDEEAKVRALAAGADDYVTKPFGPRELVARLGANLRRTEPGPDEPVIAVDGLEIDFARRTVRRDGNEIHLTPTEFDLLRLLARNRGRLMTHRDLLVAVWGAGYADDTQVLRSHIANLRRKIEPADGPHYIRTDPGVGYRFAA
jgi:DNA-binding response OmpR family regulator/signal transduction histidine kinase